MKLFSYFLHSVFFLSLCLPFGCGNSTVSAPLIIKPGKIFGLKGISLVAPVKQINSEAFAPIINTNANSVALMPYAFCSIINPEVRYNMNGQWWGESFAGAAETIKLSHENNLSIMLKPHLWLAHGEYTGKLDFPTDSLWQVWEKSYSKYILQFAALADSLKADIFCLGTELGSVVKKRPLYFPFLISEVRKLYHGKITYASNWDDYDDFPYWSQLDFIGIDAYFPLSSTVTPSVNEIVKGWDKYIPGFEKLSKKLDKKILFTEYGYRNMDKPADEPWKEDETNRNDVAQANTLEGFYEAFQGKTWFAGGYLWKWYIDDSRHHNRDVDFTPQGKAAEEVLRKWYGAEKTM